MNSEPFISVIIPTYNRAHLIERSIFSVLSQSYSRFELIVVDDASTDNTAELVAAIGDVRIRYIKCEINSGAAAARNRGIKEARYDWIAFLDSDDTWHADKLEKQVAAMDGQAGFIYCSFLRHAGDGTENIMPSADRPADRREGVIFGEMLMGNFIGIPTMLIHKSMLEKSGLFNTSLRCYEDYDLLLRLTQYTKVIHVNEVLVDVYETPGSVGLSPEAFFDSVPRILNEYRNIYEEIGLWQEKRGWLLGLAEAYGIREQIENVL